jgi:lysylphosphatidylglycerol synthetase-like protein (DUF2156 family)
MFAQAVANISVWVGAIGPTVLAGCTFTGGVVLLFSNAMPVSDARLRLVETVLPLTVVETSHFIGSIDGVLLLLSAYGIQQRLRWAWALSAVLLCAGAVMVRCLAHHIALAFRSTIELVGASREFNRILAFSVAAKSMSAQERGSLLTGAGCDVSELCASSSASSANWSW